MYANFTGKSHSTDSSREQYELCESTADDTKGTEFEPSGEKPWTKGLAAFCFCSVSF